MSGFARRFANAVEVQAAVDASQDAQNAALAAVGGSALVGFQATNAGAVARTEKAKHQESISVLDFIPVAEHAAILAFTSTYDAGPAFTAAIASLPLTGGKLAVPRGGYLIATAITTASRVTMIGEGVSETGAGNLGATVLYKAATMTGAMLTVSRANSALIGIEFRGNAGNTGDGVVIAAGRCTVRDCATYTMGNDGLRIGTDAGVNANLGFLENHHSKGNGRDGVRFSDKIAPTAPDACAWTVVNPDFQGNGGSGLLFDNAALNTCVGGAFQSNTYAGIRFTPNARYNTITGGDPEANTFKDVVFDAGSHENSLIWPSVTDSTVLDNGLRNVVLIPTATGGRLTGLQNIQFCRPSANSIRADQVGGYLNFFVNGDAATDANAVLQLSATAVRIGTAAATDIGFGVTPVVKKTAAAVTQTVAGIIAELVRLGLCKP